MLINDKTLKENFNSYEYEKIQTLKQIYIKQMNDLINNNKFAYQSFLNTFTQEERDLMEKGILSDEIINRNLHNGTNRDRSFTREDGVFIQDTFQTTFMIMFQKIVTELDTIFFFNNLGNRFEFKFNPDAVKVDASNTITSEPDFILIDKYTEETFYIEQKAFYFG